MQLTSCLIGGNELISYLLVTPTRITYESDDRIGGAHLELFGVPNEIGILIEPGLDVEIWTGNSNADAGLFGSTPFGSALFGSGSTTNRLFIGRISRVDAQAKRLAEGGAGYTVFALDCQDNSTILAETFIEEDIVFAAGSDIALIETVFSTYAPSISLGGCVEVEDALEMTVRAGWTLREFLNQVAARTGAQYNLSASTLSYAAIGTVSAPFAVREFEGTDTLTAGEGLFGSTLFGSVVFGGGSEGTTIPARMVLFDGHRYIEEWTQPCNSVVVKGKAGSGGVRVTSGTVTDSASITRYGTRSQCITDNNIQTADEAILRANAHLESFANPQKSCSFSTFDEGLAVGQTISIVMPALRMDCALYINRASLTWVTQTTVRSSFDAGFYRPSPAQIAKQNTDAGKQPPYVQIAIPAPAVIAPSHFSSTIEPVHLVAVLPTLPNATYPDNSVVVLTTTGKLYRNVAGTWSAAVATTDLTGTITTTQIADDSISTPKLQANSITAAKIGAGEVTAGKLAADSVIAGTIAAGAIRAVDAAFDTAAIQTADIANAAITDAKIDSLSASKITTGTLDAGTITVTNLNATNITTGTLNGSRIGAGTITGGAGGHIASVSITDANIASLSATKITAGTLDASVVNVTNLNASNITTGTLSASMIGAGTIAAGGGGITISGGGGLTASFLTVGGASTFNNSISQTAGTFASTSGSFTGSLQVGSLVSTSTVDTTTSYSVGGTQVVGARQAGTFTGSGWADSTAQTQFNTLITALQAHGLIA